MAEVLESIRIATQLLDGLPEGPLSSQRPIKLPGSIKCTTGRAAYASIESPRGELGTYVIANTERGLAGQPYRCKIRPPSLHSVSLIPYVCPGLTMSDMVVVVGSLDPILGEVDR